MKTFVFVSGYERPVLVKAVSLREAKKKFAKYWGSTWSYVDLAVINQDIRDGNISVDEVKTILK